MRSVDLTSADIGQKYSDASAPDRKALQEDIRSSLQSSSITVSINIDAKENAYKVFSSAFYSQAQLNTYLTTDPSYEKNTPSPANVASVILGAVEDRLSREKNDGASQEKLENLMEQARIGIERGFGQAREDISSLGLMTEELEEEISQSYNLVQGGLDRIDRGYLDASSKQVRPNEEPVIVDNPDESIVSSGPQVSKKESLSESSSLTSARFEQRYAEAESFSFNLTTRDGDEVEINLASAIAAGINGGKGAAEFSLSGEASFTLSVNGDLDAGELEAINELISQVSNVAQLFFADNFQEAFKSALNVGFDSSEIASFALDLRKVVYEEVKAYGGPVKTKFDPATVERYQPLVPMTNDLLSIAGVGELFDEPAKVISEFVAQVLEKVSSIEQSAGKSEKRGVESAPVSEISKGGSLLQSFQEFAYEILNTLQAG